MAPRKRKVVVTQTGQSPDHVKYSTAVIQMMLNAQLKEATHAKLITQLKQLYRTVQHDSFMKSFIQVVKRQMQHEEANEYANNLLKFCAKFVAEPEFSEQAVTHPVMETFFNWLLSTISNVPLVRFRICQLVNLILNALGPDATLDDAICDKILRYMLERIRDVSQQVRVQAVLALHRLQDPSSSEDSVVRAYTYHLDKDPSPKVRQTIISVLGRNYRTIPHILERLWDVDQRVRRHTYMQMSSFPVRQYKVAQRLSFLEQGLVDHSESVRKVVRNVLIPQWIESYDRDYVAFIEALKLDADEQEMDRFRKTAKMALFEIFSKNGVKEMADRLKFDQENKSVPLEELSIERAFCWHAMLEFLQKNNADEQEDYMMELSQLSEYLKKLVENPDAAAFMKSSTRGDTRSSIVTQACSPGQTERMDKLQQLYFQYILLALLEIVGMYDFTDEFGCESLKLVLASILRGTATGSNEILHEMNVRLILRTFEKLMPDVETRLKFFVDLVNSILEPSRLDFSDSSRMLVDSYLERHPDKTALKMQVTSLRLEILDLKEQESLLAQRKDYAGAQLVADQLNACNEQYANLIMTITAPETTGDGSSSASVLLRDRMMLKPRRVTPETIDKCLQICFHLVNSPTVRVLTPAVCDLYKSFISRYVQSTKVNTRNWALRASTAFSMLYDGLSKDTFQLLYQQFVDTASTRLWKTAIECVFELLDRYGFEHFDLEKDDKENSRTHKNSRQLFNRHSTGGYADESNSFSCNGNEFYKMSVHFMDTCDDDVICSTIIEGFCRLVLHGHCASPDIVSKLLLRFFNPTTDPRTQQILGIFFEALIRQKRQEILQKALLQTLFTVLEAPNESPLAEVHPEKVVKFVINSTQPIFCNAGVNPHNVIASSFLRVMHDNLSLKDLLKLLSSQLLVLDINEEPTLRGDLASAANEILKEPSLDPKTVKNLTAFRELMLGKIRERLTFSSSRAPAADAGEGENEETGDSVDKEGGVHSAGEKNPEAIDDADDDEEQEDEEDEEEEQEEERNRAEDRPQINKSILQEDSDAELLSSPLRGTPTSTKESQPNSSPTASPGPAQRADGHDSIKSLRRSLSFDALSRPEAASSRGRPVVTAARTPTTSLAAGTFKVPDASALRKIRAAPARPREVASTSETPKKVPVPGMRSGAREDEEEFEIPATQEEAVVSSSANSDADEESEVEIPETQPQSPPVSAPSKRGRGGRGAGAHNRSGSRRKNAARSNGKKSSSDSSASDGEKEEKKEEEEVVDGSPNITTTRINRSIVRPMNKVATKTLYEQKLKATPGTLPRVTRHVSRREAIYGKVMTRKSLSELGANTSSASTRSRKSSPRDASHSKPASTAPAGGGGGGRRSSRNSITAASTPLPQKPKTPTRASSRADITTKRLSQDAAAPPPRSPGTKRHHNRSSEAASSNDSGTSTRSPIRLKRAAVVLTPLTASFVRRQRSAAQSGQATSSSSSSTSSRTASSKVDSSMPPPSSSDSPRRSTRKTSRK